MKLEWVIAARRVGPSAEGPSIIGIITALEFAQLPDEIFMLGVSCRVSGKPGEAHDYIIQVVDDASKSLGSQKLPTFTIPSSQDVLDIVVALPLKFTKWGRHTVWMRSASGNDSKVVWFDVKQVTVN